jgi:predicted DNA-binding WGR domain protein
MDAAARILRRVDAAKNMDRFYELTLEPTLFGEWAVVRRWGRFHSEGRKRETWFDGPSPALVFMDRLHNQKLRRGYLDAGRPPC